MGHNEVLLIFDTQALMTHTESMISKAVALKHQPEHLLDGGLAEETATAIHCMTFLRVLAYMLAEIFSDLRARKDEPPFNTYNAYGEPVEEYYGIANGEWADPQVWEEILLQAALQFEERELDEEEARGIRIRSIKRRHPNLAAGFLGENTVRNPRK